jgi:hypothetical protein
VTSRTFKTTWGKNLTKNKNKILKKKMIATQKLFSFWGEIKINNILMLFLPKIYNKLTKDFNESSSQKLL